MNVYHRLTKAYKVSCPIVTLSTSDPAQAIRQIIGALPDCQVITWDCAAFVSVPTQPKSAAATEAKAALGANTMNLAAMLVAAENLPRGTVLIIKNAHKFLSQPPVMQAVWNLRDAFKNPRRMLILMGPTVQVPVELQHDVIELDEPLPTRDELAGVIGAICSSAQIEIEDENLANAANASQGLSAFAAEQYAALNLTKNEGMSVKGLWTDKCAKISETPGLNVISGGTFDDIAGVENAKGFLRGILNGRDKPNAIVFMDEIEKALGGAASDSSGVSQDQLQVLLQYMQDKRASGCIFLGHPGTAKSALSKTAGSEAGIPTIQFDLGATKGSLVGESEGKIRDALKVIDSISGGKTLWLATCNSLTALPPELRRRFKYGTWFFDLPTREERVAIWTLYTGRYELEMPEADMLDQEWTGAEIEACCEIAWRIGCDLQQAAGYVVPIAKAASDKVAALRDSATGRLLSASYPGVYQPNGGKQAEELASREW